jgi:uncharacterized protein YbbC (DUF1343 family)
MTVSGLERLVDTGSGRGTPFAGHRVGLLTHPAAITSDDRHAAPAGLAGITVREAYATPAFDRYAGRQVCGAQLHVTDPDAVDPPAVGVAVLCALRDGWLGRLKFRDKHFDLLAGSDGLRTALNKGSSAEEILESWREPARRFAEVEREPYLLYPRDGEY